MSSASPVPRLTLEQLVAQSENIVSGRVVRSWSSWDPSHQFVWTHHELAVRDVTKGRAGRTLVVSEPGGTVDGTTMLIPGAVQFTPGDDLLLFLYRTPIGYMRTVGWSQGKFKISPDRHVHGSGAGIDLEPASAHVPGTSLEAVEGLPVSEFQRRLSGLVQAQKGKSR